MSADRRTLWGAICLFLASSAFGASTFSGYVTDANGVEPIVGAVVSLEWTLVPDGRVVSGPAAPTRLAVWQVRTD